MSELFRGPSGLLAVSVPDIFLGGPRDKSSLDFLVAAGEVAKGAGFAGREPMDVERLLLSGVCNELLDFVVLIVAVLGLILFV